VAASGLLRLSRFSLATEEAAAATEIAAGDDDAEHDKCLQHFVISSIIHFIHYLFFSRLQWLF
jgi:hypothetical protein